VSASASTALAIGSLSTSTPLQSKMTKGPSDSSVRIDRSPAHREFTNQDIGQPRYAKTAIPRSGIYAQEFQLAARITPIAGVIGSLGVN
jgi:hypothetical protein